MPDPTGWHCLKHLVLFSLFWLVSTGAEETQHQNTDVTGEFSCLDKRNQFNFLVHESANWSAFRQ